MANAANVSEVLRTERAMHGVLNLFPCVMDAQAVTTARDETLRVADERA